MNTIDECELTHEARVTLANAIYDGFARYQGRAFSAALMTDGHATYGPEGHEWGDDVIFVRRRITEENLGQGTVDEMLAEGRDAFVAWWTYAGN